MVASVFIKTGMIAFMSIIAIYYATNTTTISIPSAHNLATSSINRLRSDIIPNQVHYVHLVRDPDSDPELVLKFKHFISIYSALIYFQPEIIYIHTDASEEAVARARNSDDESQYPLKWTRRILNLPRVVVRQETAPDTAEVSGVAIKRIEHKSDFVRVKVMHQFGGMYMDWDVHALRDIKPLREAGFANVVGRELRGEINNGCWLSQKSTALVALWMRDMHAVYDSGWTTHGNKLLTKLCERLMPLPKQVLIMEQAAFAPGSWRMEDVRQLFQAHPEEKLPSSLVEVTASESSSSEASESASLEEKEQNINLTTIKTTTTTISTIPITATEEDAESLWDGPTDQHPASASEPWHRSFSTSYVIHAFFPHKLTSPIDGLEQGVTVSYVLARRSRFARAVYPAVQHAIDAGIVNVDDDDDDD